MESTIIKTISQECKSAIEPIEIVTPEIYESTFFEIVKKNGYEVDEVEKLTKKLLDSKINSLIELNEKSSEQVTNLDFVSKKALNAMQVQDEAKLQESISEIETLRLEIKKLKEGIYKDSLTKTWTRQWLDANILDSNGRFKDIYIIAIVDLNYFKQINDKLGHIAGDRVLQFIASHLMSLNVPVVRYGGDEFILIFDSKYNINIVKEKIEICRNRLIQKKLKYGGYSFNTSFSYGIYWCKEKDSFETALEKADKQMYKDKKLIKKKVPSPF